EIGFAIPESYNASCILFDNLAAGRGERLALTGPGGTRTYAQLCAEASRWGHGFQSLGLKRGDRILMFLDDTPVYPAAFFGAVRSGFVPLVSNTLTPPGLLQFYLSDAGAAVAVAEAEFTSRFNAEACKDTPLQTLIVVNGAAGEHAVPKTFIAQQWLQAFSTDLPEADTRRDEMAFWMYSSGSTGRPKGIVHLQHDMAYSEQAFARNVLKLGPDDICFSVPKIFFAYGFGNAITFPFSVGAATLLLPGQPKPATIFEASEKYRPSIFYGLPTLYTSLTKAEGAAATDFSSLRMALSAAEVLSAEVFNGWKALTGLELIEGLGSTEALHIYLSNRPDDLIKISGQWVYPLEVELCLAEHPDIRECAVFAAELPDRRMTLKAVVVMNQGEFDPNKATKKLQDYVKEKLLPYKYPREIRFIGELPKTGT